MRVTREKKKGPTRKTSRGWLKTSVSLIVKETFASLEGKFGLQGVEYEIHGTKGVALARSHRNKGVKRQKSARVYYAETRGGFYGGTTEQEVPPTTVSHTVAKSGTTFAETWGVTGQLLTTVSKTVQSLPRDIIKGRKSCEVKCQARLRIHISR